MQSKSIIATVLIIISNQSFAQAYPNGLYMPVEFSAFVGVARPSRCCVF